MKSLIATASLLALVAATGPASAQGAAAPPSGAPRIALDQQDLTFIRQAAIGGGAEIEIGRLAMQQAADPAIRVFGRWMATDHQFGNEMLANLAQAAGVSLPTTYDQEHQADYDRLRALTGAPFDREYVPLQVQAHQRMIALFQQETQSGADPRLKLLAQRMIPMLQQHLAQAEEFGRLPDVASAANPRGNGRRAATAGYGSSTPPTPGSAGSSGPEPRGHQEVERLNRQELNRMQPNQ